LPLLPFLLQALQTSAEVSGNVLGDGFALTRNGRITGGLMTTQSEKDTAGKHFKKTLDGEGRLWWNY
jgi:hypothetical protein